MNVASSASSFLLKEARVAIVGMSMGGVASALALRPWLDSHEQMAVFERNTSFAERGQAIGLPMPMLEQLQTQNWINYDNDYHYLTVAKRDWFVRDTQTSNPKGRLVWTQQIPMTIHNWGTLHQQLLKNKQLHKDMLHMGVQVADIDVKDSGVSLSAMSGEDLGTFDLVIAADGVNSTLRPMILADENSQPIFAGYVAWRSSVPLSKLTHIPGLLEEEEEEREESVVNEDSPSNKVTILTAAFNGGQFIGYIMPGSNPHTDERSFYWLMFAPTPTDLSFDGGKSVRDVPPLAIQELLQVADEHLPPFFGQIIKASVEHDQNLWIHPIVDQVPDKLVHPSNRLLLMGDAAATLRPHTASGTVKAFADAMVMGKIASSSPTLIDFAQTYNAERVAEGQTLVKLGQHLGAAQILNPPNWTKMSPEDYNNWWLAMISGTNFAYSNPKSE